MEEERITSTDFKDNNIEWFNGNPKATASFYTKKYINRMRKLAEKFPDEVDIHENEDGSILAHFPVRYIKISHPVVREMTEEQRIASAERFAKYREEHRREE